MDVRERWKEKGAEGIGVIRRKKIEGTEVIGVEREHKHTFSL